MVTREKTAKRARIEAGWENYFVGSGGVDPSINGNWTGAEFAEGIAGGRAEAGEMNRVEVNEAFAAQYLAVEKPWG